MKIGVAALLLVLLSFGSGIVISAETNPINVSRVTVQSGGRLIRLDKYEGLKSSKGASILVLHGAGGTLADGPEMRRMARRLAEAGNTAYLVHYFNRTGTIFGFDAGMQKNFPAWLETVRDCIAFVKNGSGNRSPVGIYGYSLGGFLAVAAASNNPAVGAVVEHAGGIWNGKQELIGRMPPVLIVHGEGDSRVSFEKYARPLASVLRERGATFKAQSFPEEGHVFTAAAMSRVREAAVEFFRQHL